MENAKDKTPKGKNNELGKWGEEKTAEYFSRLGYTVLDRNFRTRAGEIDLVLWEPDGEESPDGTLVFIEVKTRLSFQYGTPALAVTPTKQRHLLAAARYYAHIRRLENCSMRYDVVEIVKMQGKTYLRHIRNAFS